jgi:hypothetical protein
MFEPLGSTAITGRVILVAREGRPGPTAMSPQEVAEFYSESPTGAMCITDKDGGLFALPAQVLAGDSHGLSVVTDRTALDAHAGSALPVCVVVDKFLSYAGIRGVITQGSIESHDLTADGGVLHVTLTQTVTFSFANVET